MSGVYEFIVGWVLAGVFIAILPHLQGLETMMTVGEYLIFLMLNLFLIVIAGHYILSGTTPTFSLIWEYLHSPEASE